MFVASVVVVRQKVIVDAKVCAPRWPLRNDARFQGEYPEFQTPVVPHRIVLDAQILERATQDSERPALHTTWPRPESRPVCAPGDPIHQVVADEDVADGLLVVLVAARVADADTSRRIGDQVVGDGDVAEAVFAGEASSVTRPPREENRNTVAASPWPKPPHH